MSIVVYNAYKLTHSGITGYKVFEGFDRKMKKKSLENLVNQNGGTAENLTYANNKKFTRTLSPAQSRRCKSLCQKLCYYSATRSFTSKKTGKYHFKVAFLTLVAPASTEPGQFLKAFDHFIDYLRRTANCIYVYKKELGETGNKLHVHILINNFIPFYIVSWKWKRLLINEGVEWPNNKAGKDTTSHYRIELPKSKKMVASYIAKYMSKAYELPKQYGYLTGHSQEIDACREIQLFEGTELEEEIFKMCQKYKIVGTKYVKHLCVDLMTIKDMFPGIFALFEKQYLNFSETLTLLQKFKYV